MERIRVILITLLILMTIESSKAFLKMGKNNPVVQRLLGNKNKPDSQPQKPNRYCSSRKITVVTECAKQYKHGNINSCIPKGKEIIWAEVQTIESSPKTGCKYRSGGIRADHAPADGSVFTYDKTTITVAGGCKAIFWICYKTPDDSVDHGCPAHWWTCNNYCRNILKCRCGGYCSRWPKRHRGKSCVCMGCKVIKDGPRTCTCKGDPHITTFEGLRYTLGDDFARRDKRSLEYYPSKPGCAYYLMKSDSTTMIVNTVHCKNTKAKTNGPSHATCVYSVGIFHKNVEYELRHDKKLYINGAKEATTLPFESDADDCSVRNDQTHIVLEFGDTSVKFNGEEVDIADESNEATEGLCGIQDNKENVELKEDLKGFAQKWKVDPTCND